MPRRKTYHHGDLGEALVHAAIAQASADGVGSVTMRAVAQRTGVTPAAAYHHFASKDHLLAACAERAFAGLLARVEVVIATTFRTALDRYEALARAYIAYALAHPAHFRIMFGAHMQVVADELSPDSAGRRTRRALEETAAAVAAELGGGFTTEQVVQVGWTSAVGVIELVLERELAPAMTRAHVDALVDTVLSVMRAGLLTASRGTRSGH